MKSPEFPAAFVSRDKADARHTLNQGQRGGEIGMSGNNPAMWWDVPATYHNNAGGLSYADGHAEIKKWTVGNVLKAKANNQTKDPNSGDLAWLQERSSTKY